jgi:tetratricopeptide (TPR) repeat protein
LTGVMLRIRARRDPVQAGMLGALLAAFVVYLAYSGFDWMWELTAVSLFGLVAVAIAIGSAGSARSGALDWRARAGLALIALFAGLTQVPGLVSTAEVRSSQEAVRAGHLQAAMADAEDAIASAPWAATPYVQRALLFERTDRLRDAERDIVRARELEPTNYRHPLLLSRIDALQGKVPQALRAFRDARALAPKKTIVEGGPASIGQPSGP